MCPRDSVIGINIHCTSIVEPLIRMASVIVGLGGAGRREGGRGEREGGRERGREGGREGGRERERGKERGNKERKE